jgi:hypothetical protein
MLASMSLGLLAFLFAGIPMIATRHLYGWKPFLLANTGVAVLMAGLGVAPLALLYMVLMILIAVFYEGRASHMGLARAGLVALTAGLSFSVLSVGIYLKRNGFAQVTVVKEQMKEFTQRLLELSPQMRLDPEVLWTQLPAILALTFIAALVIAVVMEARLLHWLGQGATQIISRAEDQLTSFRIPEVFIWLSVAVTLGAFLEMSPPLVKLVCQNAFYVLVFFYFLQGIAVVATYFDVFKVGPVWRSIWYFLMIAQLLVAVSLVGFSDYWIDYRLRIAKKATESKKEI